VLCGNVNIHRKWVGGENLEGRRRYSEGDSRVRQQESSIASYAALQRAIKAERDYKMNCRVGYGAVYV
jgi:hypothetical protein